MNFVKRIHLVVPVALAATTAIAQTPAAAAAPPATPNPTTPALVGTLTYPSKPMSIDGGPLGPIFVDGVFSGLGLWQDQVTGPHNVSQFDLSNGQIFLQNTSGKIQFFLQGGVYSLPALGAPYFKSNTVTQFTYGDVPQGFIKLVPNGNFSFLIGQLPTLIGAESTFTFENMNIFRGLLWGQEPAISRGIQGNYTKGSFTASASLNDGFFSNQYTSISGSLTDVASPKDTFEVAASGNLIRASANGFATPEPQNNSQIYNLIWTHTQGPWVIEPYLQYTSVPTSVALGFDGSASTSGAAILASYAFSSKGKLAGVTLPVRVEYISSTGSASSGAPNLLFGPGSNAWSFTVTPTYQRGDFFLRAEGSYVTLGSISENAGFGSDGTNSHQFRVAVETGIIF